MGIEFVEGKCCGDCAKCQLSGRPTTVPGMQACAVANILPIVYCCHDLLIEQNALLGKLVKKQDKEIDELKDLVKKLVNSICNCEDCEKDKTGDDQGQDEQSGQQPIEQSTEAIQPRRMSSKTK